MRVICIYLSFTCHEKYTNLKIIALTCLLYGVIKLCCFYSDVNELNERTKTAKRSLFVSNPSRGERDRRARLYLSTKTSLFYSNIFQETKVFESGFTKIGDFS